MQDSSEKKLSDMIAVAMGSVSNTGSALKIISDLQMKNDMLANQNIVLSLALQSVRNALNKVVEELEREYPNEMVINAKLKNIGKSREIKSASSVVSNFNECIQSIRLFAHTVPASPRNMEAWYRFLASLKELNINNEIKGPSSANTNGTNPIPSHKCS